MRQKERLKKPPVTRINPKKLLNDPVSTKEIRKQKFEEIIMKKMNIKIIALVLAMSMMLVLSACTSASAPFSAADRNLLSVSGTGEVTVKPDVAYINMGVTTRDPDATKVQKDNAAAMNAVIAAIKAAGIDEKDIKTSAFNMYPVYNYETQPQTITGYEINNTVSVTINDLTKVGAAITAAMGAGANTTNGISFALKDSDAAYQEALKLAVAKAEAKAKTMAEASKIKLGAPASISEGGVSIVYPMMERAADMAKAAADIGSTVQAGELKVSASVSIVYEIK